MSPSLRNPSLFLPMLSQSQVPTFLQVNLYHNFFFQDGSSVFSKIVKGDCPLAPGPNSSATKGQIKPIADWRAIDSPKKQMPCLDSLEILET